MDPTTDYIPQDAPDQESAPAEPIQPQQEPSAAPEPQEAQAQPGDDAAQKSSEASKKPSKKALAAKKRRRLFAQRRRLHNVILAGVFLLVLLLFFLINLFVKDKDFSEAENRNLAQKPAFSMTALTDGSYFSGLSDYATDQFFARDGWMSLKLKAETVMGRKDASGIFLGADGYLLGTPEEPDADALARSISNINRFAQEHSDLSFRMLLVPDAAMVLTDKLPKNAPVRDQLQDIEDIHAQLTGSIQFLNAAEALTPHADEYIYYKTDHHWTSLGAYYTFTQFAGQLGIGTPASSYNIYTVTDGFEGTLSSKSGSHKSKDSIQVYEAKGQDSYYVRYSDSDERICSLYDRSALDTKDKYTVFFGGNHPKVEISTTANNERVLLLFKDSYANSFVQFLLPYYQKIIMIDPRYYYDNLDTILSSEGVTDVLFLYSADTFIKDTSLSDVLEATGQEPEGTLVGSDGVEPSGDQSSAAEDSAVDSAAESSPETSPETSAAVSPETSPEAGAETSPEASPSESPAA